MKLIELLSILEERLVQHDSNRKDVQSQLQKRCAKMIEDADVLEEKIGGEIQKSFNEREERVLNLIEKLGDTNGMNRMDCLTIQAQAKKELSLVLKYEIQHIEKADNFIDSYKFKPTLIKNVDINSKNNTELKNKLQELLNRIHEYMVSVHDQLSEICTKRRDDAEELSKKTNEKLESLFVQEDELIQSVVTLIKENLNSEDVNKIKELENKAKLILVKEQKYTLNKEYDLIVMRKTSLKWIDFEKRQPTNVIISFTDKGELSTSFTFFNDDEINVLKTTKLSSFKVIIKLWEKNNQNEEDAKIITKDYILGDKQIYFVESFNPNSTYCLRMRIEQSHLNSEWSNEIEFITPEFKTCIWKECPDNVDEKRKYSIDKENPRIATNVKYDYCTVIGNITLPPSKVTSWNIIILNSKTNCVGTYVGVAPSDINQNGDYNCYECGWYFDCHRSLLYSGPPHNYINKEYGQRKGYKEYNHIGDIIGIVMDAAKGDLSFAVNGVNYGVAYEGIPLDKPFVPCVILHWIGDSIELDISEVKENLIDESIPIPSNITTKNDTYDSIVIAWDVVEGATLYQIEIDGSRFWYASTTNTFTKRGLPLDTEYSFRVRTVKGISIGEWSDIVKGRTQKELFEFSWWKECPYYVSKERKYTINKDNPRIVYNDGDKMDQDDWGYPVRTPYCDYCYCTIIGNLSLPPNKVNLWNIKILKSNNNNGSFISVGVGPSDINQDKDNIDNKYGWYLYCYDSTLNSGPPHNYKRKEYGLRRPGGQYVHTGDSVGIIMDTTKGELSFVVDKVDCGVAYEGIPLDKPLVPCVILQFKGDSVELVL